MMCSGVDNACAQCTCPIQGGLAMIASAAKGKVRGFASLFRRGISSNFSTSRRGHTFSVGFDAGEAGHQVGILDNVCQEFSRVAPQRIELQPSRAHKVFEDMASREAGSMKVVTLQSVVEGKKRLHITTAASDLICILECTSWRCAPAHAMACEYIGGAIAINK